MSENATGRNPKPSAVNLLLEEEGRVFQYLLEDDHPEWHILKRHTYFSEKWVVYFLRRQRYVPIEAIREIYDDIELRRRYNICRAMVANLSTPPALSMNLVNRLRWGDILRQLKQPHTPGALLRKLEGRIRDMFPRLAMGEKITIARQAPRPLIGFLRLSQDSSVLRVVMTNHFFTFEDASFLANYPRSSPIVLNELANCARWNQFKELRGAMLRHPNLPNSLVWQLLKGLTPYDVKKVLKDRRTKLYVRKIIERQFPNIH